jgi:hypothetical protein|tara:strand:- start:55 stop:318 length:264 start_codon:yes stop_codon:yes gene_type:complete
MIVDQDYAPSKKVWIPNDIKSSGEIIQWIETAPNEEVIGWLSIGDGLKVFTITQSNRHLWKDIVSEMRSHEGYLLLKQTKLVKREEK